MFELQHPKDVTADHHVAASYPDLSKVGGLDQYDARGLTMHLGRPGDIVRAPTTLRDHLAVWSVYVHEHLGLELPQIVFDDAPGSQLNGPNSGRGVLAFKLGPWATRHRPDLMRASRTVELFEDKSWFLSEICSAGFDRHVPPTWHMESGGIPRDVLPCWIKPCLGASGNGAEFCADQDDFESKFVTMQASGVAFQVQQHIEGTDSSVQFWIGEDGAVLLMTTDQIMGGEQQNEHIGNICPSQYDAALRPVAQELGDFVYASGYRGYCGFDFLVQSGTGTIYLLEMNARLTGAHYPGAMAGHLDLPQWQHIMVDDLRPGPLRNNPEVFMEHLWEHDLIWTPRDPQGVVPWYIGTIGAGKVMLLIPGDREEQQRRLDVFKFACC